MQAMADKLGPATDLADFERKAQLLNYETYRAIFEGMNAELWTRTSGRMLWMTQPAWPSTHWQILSHDYDTHAAYYGVKAAAEKVHVQLSLPDHRLELVNNGLTPLDGVRVQVRVVALDGRPLSDRRYEIAAKADDVAQGPGLGLDGLIAANGAVVVELQAQGRGGELLSRNVYWLARDAAGSRGLSQMKPQPVAITAAASGSGPEAHVTVTLDQRRIGAVAEQQADPARRRRRAHPARLLQRQLRLAAAGRAARGRHRLSGLGGEGRAARGAARLEHPARGSVPCAEVADHSPRPGLCGRLADRAQAG